MNSPRLFRYSGNKCKLVPLLPAPKGTRIVEPYAGSLAYSIYHLTKNESLTGLAYEANFMVFALLNYLKRATPERLREIQAIHESIRQSQIDARELSRQGLSEEEITYVRINTSGAYTGQLNSYVLYKQHALPVENTILALPALHRIELRWRDAIYIENDITPDDTLFLDPPYVNTHAGYKGKDKEDFILSYKVEDTLQLVSKETKQTILTYHDPSVFPSLRFAELKRMKVPNLRRGGTTDRVEYVYIKERLT